ncbi:hypothetical protein FSP39_018837 [Pinctada imbricata]|uniref:Bestrophin homolog n=1 Tax=Pinctada imbricata TaxID=66713 RepID=A0AA88YLD4_PINIB|nr:hypothetical protein FSP39_018837 [Pinctada imbricata]
MTITYQYRVANVTLGTFVKLLGMWRGSVYKLVYKEMLIFTGMYLAISLTYRLALNQHQRTTFETVVMYCENYLSLIPVSFVLGFYVTMVVQRWWTQFMNVPWPDRYTEQIMNVPWPDRTLYLTCCYLEGSNDRGHKMRCTIARYMLFGLILICRSISVAVMKRFPSLDHLVEAGFITKEEATMYEQVDCKYNKFWVPLVWANGLLAQARKDNCIKTDFGLRMIIEVVTLAVYSFFATCLIGRQFLDPIKKYPGHEYDLYVPVFTLLQFFFYMGWLKVAEQLINPFGEDDDDFDINWLLDRHMAVAMTLVDQMYGTYPPLDTDGQCPEHVTELPYTEASRTSKRPMFLGSSYNLAVPSLNDQRMLDPEEIADHRSHHTPFGSHFAGSMLSLLTGRVSMSKHNDHYGIPFDRVSNFSGNYYMDHLHVPNGDTHPHQRKNHSVVETNLPQRKISVEMSGNRRGSAWASDSDVAKLDQGFVGRERSSTIDDTESTIKKKNRKRKISFPPNLIRFLREGRKYSTGSMRSQRSGGTGSSKSVYRTENTDDYSDNTPEYVPLKRASNTGILRKKSGQHERKRKSSFPLTFSYSGGENSDQEPNRPVQKPESSLQAIRQSRFTVEQVPDDVEEATPLHIRNAQKLKEAMSGKNVSRAPVLSAIEEGGTITSMTQILPDEDDVMPLVDHVIHEDEEIQDAIGQERESTKAVDAATENASAIDNYEEYRVRADSDPHIYSEPEEINSLNPGKASIPKYQNNISFLKRD